jgi:hypothetical protein
MVRTFVTFGLMMSVVGFSSAAFAEEKLMVLWPKQRAAHQITMDDQAAAYHARGQAYVDHLYDTAGEEPMPPADDFMGQGEIQPVPINVGRVAEMVKGADANAKVPSPDAQTAPTPH